MLLSIPGALLIGAYPLSMQEIWSAVAHKLGLPSTELSPSLTFLVVHVRLPRILLAVLVGSGLAISGAAIQGLFRNPLADPALIGVTSGAMVFAVAGIVLSGGLLSYLGGWSVQFLIAFLSFIGSLSSTLLIYRLATSGGQTSVTTMLLAGIAVTALAAALTGLMVYASTDDELRDITFWTLGSLGGASWQVLIVAAPAILLPIGLLLWQSSALDLLMLGETEAQYMGLNIQRAKWIIIGSAALAVGVAVSVSGVIGFVALVVPHLIRLLGGSSHAHLLPCSALLGGVLLLWADAFARTIIAPAELPIGIITALLGAPFFLWLLVRAKNRLTYA